MYYQSPSFGELLVAFMLGALIGSFFSDKFRPFRKYLAYALGLVVLIAALKVHIPGLPHVILFVAGLVVAIRVLADKITTQQNRVPEVYGDAAWADLEHLQQAGMLEPGVDIVGGER